VVDDHVMVSLLASSVVNGRVIVIMLASSVVDDHVMVSLLASSVVDGRVIVIMLASHDHLPHSRLAN
jgi:hypothetical protein